MLQWISSVLHAQITRVVTEIYTVSTEFVNVQERTIGHQTCVLQVSFVIYYCMKSTASVVLWLECSPRVRRSWVEPGRVKSKTMQLVFVASPQSTHH